VRKVRTFEQFVGISIQKYILWFVCFDCKHNNSAVVTDQVSVKTLVLLAVILKCSCMHC